jgi:hypothetical protein
VINIAYRRSDGWRNPRARARLRAPVCRSNAQVDRLAAAEQAEVAVGRGQRIHLTGLGTRISRSSYPAARAAARISAPASSASSGSSPCTT